MESSEPVQSPMVADPRTDAVLESERGWLLRTREGDTEAFARLVQAYRRPIYAYLGRCGIVERDRDDLFQDIFLKIYRAAASYDPNRPVHPWVFTIVGNSVRTYLRKRKVRGLVFGAESVSAPESPEMPDEAPDGERRALARQRVRMLESELQKLTEIQRQVVVLASVERLTMAEIASAVALPVNTVKTHLRRARLALAKGMAQRERSEEPSAEQMEARS